MKMKFSRMFTIVFESKSCSRHSYGPRQMTWDSKDESSH